MKLTIQTIDGDFVIDEDYTGIIRISSSEAHNYVNGHLHNDSGPAIIMANGDKFYYQYSKLHRLDNKPAIDSKDGKFYYLEGKLHRTDGPAVDIPNNKEYWLNGIKLLYKDFLQKTGLLKENNHEHSAKTEN